jgi:hypothetical protein
LWLIDLRDSDKIEKICDREICMFKVVTSGFSQEFERWTDALNTAKSLIPQCKSLMQDIRIFLFDELIWLYSREHKYPKYIGAGTYDRLAKLFLIEAMEEESTETTASANPGSDDVAN